MKTVKFALVVLMIFLFQNCGPKEKVEEITSDTDSTLVEPEVLEATQDVVEIQNEVIPAKEQEVVKEEALKTPTPKVTEIEKPVTKQVVKSVTESKVEPKVEEPIKKEVTAEKVVEKKEEVKKEEVVVKEEVKSVAKVSDWVVPEKDKNLKNPLESSKDNTREGKLVYDVQCKSCHGARGLGDGMKAKSMKGDLGDFSSAKFQAQTDGELFYKTKVGRADMPSYAKKLTDEDIWLVVLYMRTLKK